MHKWPKKVDGKYPRHSVDKAISQLNVDDFMIAKTAEDRILFLNTMRSFYGKGCAKTFWVKSKKHFKCIRKK
tara:strand:- start:25 stop:240 length:216 start_codon:yes stop_codon:yes gene_type:complete